MTDRLLELKRTHTLARAFAFEWLSPSGAPLTPTGQSEQDKLETLLVAFAAVLVRGGSAPAPAKEKNEEESEAQTQTGASMQSVRPNIPSETVRVQPRRDRRVDAGPCQWNCPNCRHEMISSGVDMEAFEQVCTERDEALAESAARIAQFRDITDRMRAWADSSDDGYAINNWADELDALLTPAAQENG